MNETSKTRALWGPEVQALLRGRGIDIGCGSDPVRPDVERFDRSHGDANRIGSHVSRQYDYVFSSHCLEHMENPRQALAEWFELVKPGGHLIALVPDEDLYEQGVFPSLFNADHTHTFTVAKTRSWSARSLNVMDLVRDLPGELVSVELQDYGYDRRLLRHTPSPWSRYLYRRMKRTLRWSTNGTFRRLVTRVFAALGAIVDQTEFPDARLAQIQFIVKKRGEA
jgi:SAM-dependent methyltransferase